MMTRSLILSPVMLAFSASLLATGCASLSGTTPRAVVSQSYDLPGTLDANVVIRAVERAFTRTLLKPPRIVEGSVPSPLPATPAQFRIEERLVHLDRLGMVSIPEIVCPESMAIVQSFVTERSESSGPRSLTGCVQLYAGGYHVSLVDSLMGGDRHEETTLLSRLAQALRDEVSETRLAADFHAQESATPRAFLASQPDRSVTPHAEYREEDVVSTLPLVCLAPRGEMAPVRATRGEGHVVTVLDSGAIMTVAEPVDPDYFLVETEDGMAGWLNSADVRRLPCPIG